MSVPKKALVDASVWIDYFLCRDEASHRLAMDLVAQAADGNVVLYTSAASLSDLFFVLEQETKRLVRETGGEVSPASASAIRESAWASVRNVAELSLVAPVAQSETLQALSLRELHDDFEDDLTVAAALRVGADFIVTPNRRLRDHAPVSCLSVEDMLTLLRAMR